MSQQGLRQSSFRQMAGGLTTGDYNSNLIAASEAVTGLTGHTVDGAEILLLQAFMGSSETNLEGLRAEYAGLVGASDWDSVGDIVPFFSGGGPDLFLNASNEYSFTLNGSGVAGWADMSGNGNDATQETESAQPTYSADAINGRPGLTFDGGDYLRVSDFSYSTTALSVFVVAEIPSSASFGTIIGHFDTGAGQRSWRIGRDSAASNTVIRVQMSDDGSFGAGHRKDYSSSVTGQTDATIFGFTFDAGTLTLYNDGVADTSPTKNIDDAITSLHNSTADLTIGASLNNDSISEALPNGSKVAIATLAGVVLSASEVSFLNNYLKSYYNIS